MPASSRPAPLPSLARCAFVALCLLGAPVLFAQDGPTHGPRLNLDEKGDVLIKCWRVETRTEEGRRTTILTGNVELTRGDIVIKAENMVGWLDETRKAPVDSAVANGDHLAQGGREKGDATNVPPDGGTTNGPPDGGTTNGGAANVNIQADQIAEGTDLGVGVRFDEVYAEGNVRLLRGRQQIEAERLYYSLADETALIYDAIIRLPGQGLRPPVIVRAKTVRRLGPDSFEAENASVSTCEYGDPHYHLSLRFLRVEFGKPETLYVLSGITPKFLGAPVFYWPKWRSFGFPTIPFRALRYRKTGQYGHFLHTEWGGEIHRNERDANGALVLDKNGQPRPHTWGTLWLDADYYSKRGIGVGPAVEYKWGDYEGSAEAYWVRDRGPDPNRSYEQQFLPLEKHDRGRLRTFHRHALDEDWRLDLESAWLSDRHVLQEFFVDEFKEGKDQETYAYLRYRRENVGGTLTEKIRWNDFLDQTEYLPRAQGFLIGEPLWGDRLSYTAKAEIANVRRQFDEAWNFPSYQIWRFDTEHEIAAPFDVSFVTFRPFVRARASAFEEDLAGHQDVYRGTLSAGTRAFWQMNRVYDVENETLGIDDLRHIMEFDLRYTSTFANTQPSVGLIPFDAVDFADKFDEVYLEWRHRLATKRAAERRPWEFLDAAVAVEYYPDRDRDTGLFRAQNFLTPFSWITNAPRVDGTFGRRDWSNVHWDLTLTPETIFSFRTGGEWNPHRDKIEVSAYGVNVDPSPDLGFAIWSRYVEDIAHTVGFDVAAKLTDRWSSRVQVQYDLRQDRFSEQKMTLYRDIHEFTLDLTFRVSESTGDTSFTFGISPSGLTARQRRY